MGSRSSFYIAPTKLLRRPVALSHKLLVHWTSMPFPTTIATVCITHAYGKGKDASNRDKYTCSSDPATPCNRAVHPMEDGHCALCRCVCSSYRAEGAYNANRRNPTLQGLQLSMIPTNHRSGHQDDYLPQRFSGTEGIFLLCLTFYLESVYVLCNSQRLMP